MSSKVDLSEDAKDVCRKKIPVNLSTQWNISFQVCREPKMNFWNNVPLWQPLLCAFMYPVSSNPSFVTVNTTCMRAWNRLLLFHYLFDSSNALELKRRVAAALIWYENEWDDMILMQEKMALPPSVFVSYANATALLFAATSTSGFYAKCAKMVMKYALNHLGICHFAYCCWIDEGEEQ